MEILYSEPITEAPLWIWILFIVMIIISFIAFTDHVECKGDISCIVAIIGIIATLILLGIIGVMNEKRETGRTRYEVILDEDYPVSKLYEEYIVKEQRGKIWILEDKESRER